MDPKEKNKILGYELTLIKNKEISNFVEKAIGLLPDYFFEIPASTSQKYHPKFAAGEGGLVRHTQAATRLAKDLLSRLDMLNYFSEDDKDLILASSILHDGYKAGIAGKHTVTEHPILMSRFLQENFNDDDIINSKWLNIICENIEHHMGAWTKDYRTGQEVLEKPHNKMQNFVHLVDYIVSRKFIGFDLEYKEFLKE